MDFISNSVWSDSCGYLLSLARGPKSRVSFPLAVQLPNVFTSTDFPLFSPFVCPVCPAEKRPSRETLFQHANTTHLTYLPTWAFAVQWRGLTLRSAQSKCSQTTGKLCDSHGIKGAPASVHGVCLLCVCVCVLLCLLLYLLLCLSITTKMMKCTTALPPPTCTSVCLSVNLCF